jgi:predicted O-linked N-acetylglucosamine transferase (SPINDLY family)
VNGTVVALSDAHGAHKGSAVHRRGTSGSKLIRVGFLSTFFKEHSVGRLLGPVITAIGTEFKDICAEHDADQDMQGPLHPVICVTVIRPVTQQHTPPAAEAPMDPIERAMRDAVYEWLDVDFSELGSLSRKVRKLNLDVLVFGDTVMESKTAYVTSLRMASTQVAFWGHPFTSGSHQIDYFVTSDKFEKHAVHGDRSDRYQHFTEQLVRFDSLSFALHKDADWGSDAAVGSRAEYIAWLTSRARDVTGKSLWDRVSWVSQQKPESVKVYACLQSTMKMHPAFDTVLVELLRADPRGVVVLLRNPAQQLWQDALQARLVRAINAVPGLSDSGKRTTKARLLFVDQMDSSGYRRTLCGAHVSLDPFPFGGGVTMVDAVHCYPRVVPFVTLPSAQSVHPIAAGIASTLGASGLFVADDVTSYLKKATALAGRDMDADVQEEVPKRVHRLTDPRKAAKEWVSFLYRACTTF